MHALRVGRIHYLLPDSDGSTVLAHALGVAFIELQQLEFSIISYLSNLAGEAATTDNSFDVFASKTFGNLLRSMAKYDYLQPLVAQLGLTKEKRDFFVHRFLFHRYGGELMTSESDYEGLIQEAVELGKMFAAAHTSLHDFMFAEAPLVLFAAKRDPDSGELKFIESEYLLRQTTGGPSREPHQ